MFVLVARWPPPSTVSYILSNQAMASGNEGQGHLLIGCRCWVFDWQEGNAVSAGACQLSSCSEKTLQTHGGLLTQHVNIIYRNSRASLLSHQPCSSFPKSLLTQPHIFHKASQCMSHWWTYANIVKWKDQKEGNEEKKGANQCQLTGLPGGPMGPVSPGIPVWPYYMYINTDLGLLPTQPYNNSRKLWYIT